MLACITHQFTFEFFITVKENCQVQRQEVKSSILNVCKEFTFTIGVHKLSRLLVEVEAVHIFWAVGLQLTGDRGSLAHPVFHWG